jgi:hypothetical protein
MKITFNKIFLGIAVVGLTAFTSCKDEEKTPETTPNTQMSGNTSGSAETPDVNPPHGEPGHRCDMPVGASLKGGNTANSQPEMNTSPIRVEQDKPAKNPPHGEPYHDCSIPVGEDLKS